MGRENSSGVTAVSERASGGDTGTEWRKTKNQVKHGRLCAEDTLLPPGLSFYTIRCSDLDKIRASGVREHAGKDRGQFVFLFFLFFCRLPTALDNGSVRWTWPEGQAFVCVQMCVFSPRTTLKHQHEWQWPQKSPGPWQKQKQNQILDKKNLTFLIFWGIAFTPG